MWKKCQIGKAVMVLLCWELMSGYRLQSMIPAPMQTLHEHTPNARWLAYCAYFMAHFDMRIYGEI